uniref:NADH-ubiquinone oxidoreductase chain 4L n=1 Tax=Prionoglaris stygia TaxID=1954335 RepID=A0A343QCD1_9NEOP|nr:NADH dehydrogenase subunit 4L [Prionoglaris stygia]ATU07078.1 NADH dehydrogenase subunit 4L [Prionoglaris stygia]
MKLDFLILISLLGSFIGMKSFIFYHKHILSVLLSLEFMMMSIYISLFFYMLFYFDLYFMMIYLTLCVCEAVLGLSLLIMIIRSSGTEMHGVLSMIKC